jgi:hypothetical protein
LRHIRNNLDIPHAIFGVQSEVGVNTGMRMTLLILFLALMSIISCSRKQEVKPVNYDLSITAETIALNGKVMTKSEINRKIAADFTQRGYVGIGSVSLHIDSDAPYGRVLSSLPGNMLCLDDYTFFVGNEQPLRVVLRNGDYCAVPEELITIAEKNIRTQYGVIPFEDLDLYLSESKAKNTNIRVIVNATTNAAMIDFRSALIRSRRYTEDVLWGFGDGSIVCDSGDWKRWRPNGNVLTEYKRLPQQPSPGDSMKLAPEK